MTTWAQPIRHPWFNPPTMKRKLPAADDDDDDDGDDGDAALSSAPGRQKRVRYGSLERTLAHMTLASEDVDMWPKVSPPHPREESANVVLPSSVEEPGTVLVSEPTDMEVEPTLGHGWELDIKEVEISSAVLDRLKRRPPAPILSLPRASQALVLYRAPRPPSPTLEQGETRPRSITVAHEDDVMEVE